MKIILTNVQLEEFHDVMDALILEGIDMQEIEIYLSDYTNIRRQMTAVFDLGEMIEAGA
jgi:hypothetical protein